ncbi:MAG: type II toxin-antitoxin system HigB family toxin [Opitutaceae bacterium]|nr:type II toxin-antitoxin system HigB family toxin [Opitutaceae bacterium]
MRVIARKTLKDFWVRHADAEPALRAWFHEARSSRWKSFSDIRSRYRSADALPGDRVVFNIKGNNYRLIIRIHYNTGIVFIRFVGTHAAYDRIDATTI